VIALGRLDQGNGDFQGLQVVVAAALAFAAAVAGAHQLLDYRHEEVGGLGRGEKFRKNRGRFGALSLHQDRLRGRDPHLALCTADRRGTHVSRWVRRFADLADDAAR